MDLSRPQFFFFATLRPQFEQVDLEQKTKLFLKRKKMDKVGEDKKHEEEYYFLASVLFREGGKRNTGSRKEVNMEDVVCEVAVTGMRNEAAIFLRGVEANRIITETMERERDRERRCQ